MSEVERIIRMSLGLLNHQILRFKAGKETINEFGYVEKVTTQRPELYELDIRSNVIQAYGEKITRTQIRLVRGTRTLWYRDHNESKLSTPFPIRGYNSVQEMLLTQILSEMAANGLHHMYKDLPNEEVWRK